MEFIKTGIMGGTFNPIHNAHLAMGMAALKQVGLHQVWFMPSRNPPHKKGLLIADSKYRAEMIRLAIEPYSGFAFSDFELRRTGTTYTVDTLALLNQKYPEREFYFIMGGDSFLQFESWYQPGRILEEAVILAFGRKDISPARLNEQKTYLEEKYDARIQLLTLPDMNISSSLLREMAAAKQDITTLVPESIAEYICQNKLY